MVTVTCEYAWCREGFPAQRSTARYCSSRCRVAAFHRRERQRAEDKRWAEGEYRPCDNMDCDNLLTPGDRPDKKFCSNACKQKYYRECGGPPISAANLAGFAALAEEYLDRR